jgi:transposase
MGTVSKGDALCIVWLVLAVAAIPVDATHEVRLCRPCDSSCFFMNQPRRASSPLHVVSSFAGLLTRSGVTPPTPPP